MIENETENKELKVWIVVRKDLEMPPGPCYRNELPKSIKRLQLY